MSTDNIYNKTGTATGNRVVVEDYDKIALAFTQAITEAGLQALLPRNADVDNTKLSKAIKQLALNVVQDTVDLKLKSSISLEPKDQNGIEGAQIVWLLSKSLGLFLTDAYTSEASKEHLFRVFSNIKNLNGDYVGQDAFHIINDSETGLFKDFRLSGKSVPTYEIEVINGVKIIKLFNAKGERMSMIQFGYEDRNKYSPTITFPVSFFTIPKVFATTYAGQGIAEVVGTHIDSSLVTVSSFVPFGKIYTASSAVKCSWMAME